MGKLPVEEFSIPIISVGNLTVGGTGKTPLIEYLIELLLPHYRVAILSRGYRRKSKGFVLADKTSSAQSLGDEPFQIYCKYPQAIVAVDSNRRRGIKNLLQLDNAPDVILLDDAHQHRYVRPTLSIVLSDYNRPIYRDLPLPAGRLREPIDGLKRADIVMLTKCDHRLSYEELCKEAGLLNFDVNKMYASHIEYGNLRSLSSNKLFDISSIISPDTHVIIMTGIANPQPLHDYIDNFTKHITTFNYPDHHNYTPHEINMVVQKASKLNAIIITTEKDYARLDSIDICNEMAQRCFILPLKINIQQFLHNTPFDTLIKGIIRHQ